MLRIRRVDFPFAEEEVVEVVAAGPPPSIAAALRQASFPLKRHTLTEADADAFFGRLCAYAPHWRDDWALERHATRLWGALAEPLPLTYGGRLHVLRYTQTEYANIDRLGDFFSEHERIRARVRGDRLSLAEAWRLDAFREAVVRAALARFGRVDAHTLRESMWGLRGAPREATAFKPTYAVSVLRTLGRARRVLDFSAGWGDRLLAALAHRATRRYVGVDPNRALRPCHDAIVRKFGGGGGGGGCAVRMLYEPFEDVHIDERFDVVFTSPPFFDIETYGDGNEDERQSLTRHRSLHAWLDGWLAPVLRKAWAMLDAGGVMAIHMCDTRIVRPMLQMLGALPGARYTGALFCTGAKTRPMPTWVFTRVGVVES